MPPPPPLFPPSKGLGTIQVPHLQPKDLYERRVARDHARLRAYNTLLEQIYHRVYKTSQLSGSAASILYTVPPFILGLPKLDLEDCIVYLVFQLRQSGFDVRFTYPNLLFISWKHHEKEYLTKQNPIIQAMKPVEPLTPVAPPPPPRQSKKKQQLPGPSPNATGAVSFNEEIAIITGNGRVQPESFASPFGQAPARRAADYQPPASFLQQMDKPTPQRQSALPGGGGAVSGGGSGDVLADLWKV